MTIEIKYILLVKKMANVLIVDDQLGARNVLSTAVESVEGLVVKNTIENARLAYTVCLSGQIDVVLMDVYTEHGENGIEAAAQIKKDFPWIKIIIVTSMAEVSFLEKAKEAGADSFWYKDEGETSLVEVLKKTLAGEGVWPQSTPVVNVGEILSTEFTQRELEVLREIVNEHTYEEIKGKLHIEVTTINYHVKNMLVKTGFRTKTGLIAAVTSKRLIIPDLWETSHD